MILCRHCDPEPLEPGRYERLGRYKRCEDCASPLYRFVPERKTIHEGQGTLA